jgi:octanoyl-[GcvH]:protein N-octanoyltransferase
MTIDLVTGRAGDDPALDLSLAPALLELVASGRRGPLLRVYRPLPTVAFGRRDSFLPGFPRAAAAARGRGFTPVIRSAGGRAAAYHDGCLVVDEIVPEADAMPAIRDRFAAGAESQARALQGLGIDARVGGVPGEYCPGEFSVNARGQTKLIGAAQRIIRGAWLFSAVVVVSGSQTLRVVLEDVYRQLGLEWDPGTTGSVADEVSAITSEQVRQALLAEYGRRIRLRPAQLTETELAAGRRLLGRHRVDEGRIAGATKTHPSRAGD